MRDEGCVHCHCFGIVQVNTNVVMRDIVECRDSKDGSACVVIILYSWSLIRERTKWRENVVCNSEASCRGMTCVGRLVV